MIIIRSSQEPTSATAGYAATILPARPWAVFAARVAAPPRPSTRPARTRTGILRRAERWPCGNLPVQAARDSGMPAWTEADRSVENTDVVLPPSHHH
jgi:hypothetical protein